MFNEVKKQNPNATIEMEVIDTSKPESLLPALNETTLIFSDNDKNEDDSVYQENNEANDTDYMPDDEALHQSDSDDSVYQGVNEANDLEFSPDAEVLQQRDSEDSTNQGDNEADDSEYVPYDGTLPNRDDGTAYNQDADEQNNEENLLSNATEVNELGTVKRKRRNVAEPEMWRQQKHEKQRTRKGV